MIKLSFILFILMFHHIASADFVFGTMVRTAPGESKRIETLQIGDLIQTLTASSKMKKIHFENIALQFSSGTGPSTAHTMLVRIDYYLNEKAKFLVTTGDQPFYTSKGNLIRADQLLLDRDELVGEDGSMARIFSLSKGAYSAGIHAIATRAQNNIENTIIVNGVLAGSFKHQIYFMGKDLGRKGVFEMISF